MSIEKIIIDKMSINNTSVDKISVDKLPIDEMTCCYLLTLKEKLIPREY
jgi:hypothetical protein